MMDKNNSVIQIKNLTKNYKALKAVDCTGLMFWYY